MSNRTEPRPFIRRGVVAIRRGVVAIRRGVVARHLVPVLAVGMIAAGCGSGDDAVAPTLPAVELTDVSGATVSTASWAGSPLVINFWYSTCVPCAKELREFAEVDAEVDDVRFIGVNPLDSPEDMVAFAAERGVSYDLFQDTVAELQTELEISSFPRTFFVTADGDIVDARGVLDADGLRGGIDDLRAADQT